MISHDYLYKAGKPLVKKRSTDFKTHSLLPKNLLKSILCETIFSEPLLFQDAF